MWYNDVMDKIGLYGLLFPSGKWYWGEGVYNQRCKSYKYLTCHNQKKLLNALKCYGFESTKRVFYPMPKEMAVVLEPLYIEFYDSRRNGYNSTDGGDTNWTHSEETKAKLRKSGMYGKKHSDETRAKMRKTHLGMKQTPEAIEKARMAHIGRKCSLETKNKISIANKGKKAWNKGKKAWNKGYSHSDETREKIRMTAKKRWAKYRGENHGG